MKLDHTPPTELISRRYSCRTYINLPIEKGLRDRLSVYVEAQNEGPLGGRARFELVASTEADLKALKGLGTYGFIRGATGFIVGAMDDDARNLEDYGFLLEKIVLYATGLGLGTCWLGGTFTKSSFAERISAGDGELVPAVCSVGYPAKKPRRIDKIIRRGAKADKRKPWSQLFFDREHGASLTRQAAGDYADVLEMVRIAPSASNKQPWRIIRVNSSWHFYLERSPGYRKQRLGKLSSNSDLQRIDMGIAMCHFQLTAGQQGCPGHWVRNEPRQVVQDQRLEYTATWVEG